MKTDECMHLTPPEGEGTDVIKGVLRLSRNFVHPAAQVVSCAESKCESTLHGAYGEGGNTMYSSASYTQDDNNL